MAFSETFLCEAHRHCGQNRAEVEASRSCGCFYCGEIYGASEVSAWIEDHWNDGTPPQSVEKWTARCPRCDIDSVVGDASGLPIDDQLFLLAMRERWF